MIKRLLVAALLPFVGTTALAQSSPPLAKEHLTVWDATGKRVGNAIQAGPVIVALEFEGTGFLLTFYRDRVEGWQSTTASSVFYDVPDCSGSAFLLTGAAALLPTDIVMSNGDIWVADISEPLRIEPTFYSYRSWDNLCHDTPGGTTYPSASPALKLFNWRDYFTPPFSIR